MRGCLPYLLIVLALICPVRSDGAPVDMTGDLEAYLGLEMPTRMGREGSADYLVPSPHNLTQALEMFRLMENPDSVGVLAGKAETIGYRVVIFEDADRGRFLIFEENPQRRPKASWGTYVVNLNSSKSLMIEITHPLFEVGTVMIGVSTFTGLGARYLLVAGCDHRALELEAAGNRRYYPSDMTVAPNSLFHLAHKVWYHQDMTAIAVSGWWDGLRGPGDNAYHADVILSNGAVIRRGSRVELDPAYSGSIEFLQGLADVLNSQGPFFPPPAGRTYANAVTFGPGIAEVLSAESNIHAAHSRTTAGQGYRFAQMFISRRLRNLVQSRGETGNSYNRFLDGLKIGLNDPPAAPQVRSPESGESFLPPYRVVLSVINARDPDLNQPIQYEFEVSEDPDFGRPVFQRAAVPEGDEGITHTVLELEKQRPGELFWRARASDGIAYGPYGRIASMVLLPSSMQNPLFGTSGNLLFGGLIGVLACFTVILLASLVVSRRKLNQLVEQLDIQRAINDNHTVRIGYLEDRLARFQPEEKETGAD